MSSRGTPLTLSPPMPYFVLPNDHFVHASDSACSSPDPHNYPETMPSPVFSAVSAMSSSLVGRSAYEQQLHDEKLRSSLKLGNLPFDLSSLPILFPRARARKNGKFIRYPIINIIALAIRSSPRQALTLSQIYDTIEENLVSYQPAPGETARDRAQRVQWQSSVRHSLSLQRMFEKVDRLPSGTKEKRRGHYWTVNPFLFGLTRRTEIIREKKIGMAAVEEKKKRPSRAKPRPRARDCLSPSPKPQPQEPLSVPSYGDHMPRFQQYESYKVVADYAHLPNPLFARPRDLHDLPLMDLPRNHPVMSSISSMASSSPQNTGYQVGPYALYPPYSTPDQYQPMEHYGLYDALMSMSIPIKKGYEAEQGISPSLLHAPMTAQPRGEPAAAAFHGRSLRSRSSRQRRDALVPC